MMKTGLVIFRLGLSGDRGRPPVAKARKPSSRPMIWRLSDMYSSPASRIELLPRDAMKLSIFTLVMMMPEIRPMSAPAEIVSGQTGRTSWGEGGWQYGDTSVG